jgi:hypothetical protein
MDRGGFFWFFWRFYMKGGAPAGWIRRACYGYGMACLKVMDMDMYR